MIYGGGLLVFFLVLKVCDKSLKKTGVYSVLCFYSLGLSYKGLPRTYCFCSLFLCCVWRFYFSLSGSTYSLKYFLLFFARSFYRGGSEPIHHVSLPVAFFRLSSHSDEVG